MRSLVGDLLADLAAAMDDAGVDWYLFGAQAAILYGVSRLTADVDVTVRLVNQTSQLPFSAMLERHAFRRRVADAQFVERTRVIPFIHAPTAIPVDVVIAGPGIEDRFFERAVAREVEGTRVRVASAEDLVVMKILAGRAKDIDDVRAIVAALARAFDIAYSRQMLELLQDALGQSDLLPAFDDIIEGSRPS